MLIYLNTIDSDSEKRKFEVLYETYRNLMLYIALQKLHHQQDAEDVVHQAFLKIIGILETIDDPLSPRTKALVAMITERSTVDYWRKQNTRIRKLSEVPYDDHEQQTEDPIEEHLSFAEAIAALPEKYRTPILLKYDQGYSHAQIAEILGTTESNIRKTVQRGKEKLRKLLEE